MKPFLPITLLTWMCLFGASSSIQAQSHSKSRLDRNANRLMWHQDFCEASQMACQSDKKLFLWFDGAGQCSRSAAFEQNILQKASFHEAASEDYVFVRCRVSDGQHAHCHRQLAERFQVSSYPTVVVADAKGSMLKSLPGYRGESVSSYLAML